MWALPSITAMNSEKAASQAKFKRAIKSGRMDGKNVPCDSADEHCQGKVSAEPYYDIFSNDISGLIAQCEYHRDREGTPEGYFYCDGCNRTMLENITWELYYVIREGSQLCLPCYAEEILNDDSPWILLTDEAIDGVTFAQVRKAPHCIAVKMPIPEGIEFVNNVEFDSMDGHRTSGGGLDELKQTLRDLKAEGATRAILILDAAYQFAVSIGVYRAVKGGQYDPSSRVEQAAEAKQ